MTLQVIADNSGGQITDENLASIEKDLAALAAKPDDTGGIL